MSTDCTTAARRYLQGLTDPLVYGLKRPDRRTGRVVPQPYANKDTFNRCLRTKPHGYRPTAGQYDRHFRGEETLYFYGRLDRPTLLMIDVDCHRKGTPDGARRFLRHLEECYFPWLYSETSTHGNGMHGYPLLDTEGQPAQEVKRVLKGFQAWLQKEAEAVGADIELVEVKGQPCVYADDQPRLEKFGQLAKLPREVPARFMDLALTTRLRLSDLRERFCAEVKAEHRRGGSTPQRLISEDELAHLPALESLAALVCPLDGLEASGGRRVRREDFVVALLLTKAFKEHPNPDNSLPTKRIQGLWEAIQEELPERYRRAWCNSRWKVIRDTLSSFGLIQWHNHCYTPGVVKEDGEAVEGKACQWEITDALYEELRRLLAREEASGTFASGLVRQGVYLVPVRVLSRRFYDLRAEEIWLRRAESQLEVLMAA